MGRFRPRRRLRDVEMERYDLAPDIHQMMRLLSRGEVYNVVPGLKPIWPMVIRIACAIDDMKSERRQDTANRIWPMYTELYAAFLDRVRELHEQGDADQLANLKPIVKLVLRTDVQWLVFHCPTSDGRLIHVMV